MMKWVRAGLVAGGLLVAGTTTSAQQAAATTGSPAAGANASPVRVQVPAATRAAIERLIDAGVADTLAYRRVGELVDAYPGRLGGSAALEGAIDWALARMKADGLENVHAESVLVPHWVRGAEAAELAKPRAAGLHMLGLGGSVATPAGGITAPVLVVSGKADLERRAAQARGKIVLFDAPFVSYGETVQYRSMGAIWAARVGAVASLIRTVGPFSIQSPHTGSLRYDTAQAGAPPKIPGAALSVEDAMMLHRMQDRGETPVVHLVMSGRTLEPAPSRNVIGELRGSERPEEIVVVSGHLDSWDVGQGAMDDAGGAVAAWEAVRLMKQLGLRPKRTVRVVLWTNEENGVAGGRGYAREHAAELPRHVLAIESDEGTFRPLGFSFAGEARLLAAMQAVAAPLARIGAGKVEAGGGETDIGPMMRQGVPGMGLTVEGSRYFWYHHSAGDTLDKLDPKEVALCVAALAGMAYGVADVTEIPAAGTPR
ncbi:MAG TPA: M20/M25/M40 family metallo-hydrolase [Longimicrobiales bacterium]